MKKDQTNKIEAFMNRAENKNWWRMIRDELNNRDIILNDQ